MHAHVYPCTQTISVIPGRPHAYSHFYDLFMPPGTPSFPSSYPTCHSRPGPSLISSIKPSPIIPPQAIPPGQLISFCELRQAQSRLVWMFVPGPLRPINSTLSTQQRTRRLPVLTVASRTLHVVARLPNFMPGYFPPFSPCCSHTGLLTKPDTCQPYSHASIFAWDALPLKIHMACSRLLLNFGSSAPL